MSNLVQVWTVVWSSGAKTRATGSPEAEGFVEFTEELVIVWPWHSIDRVERPLRG